MSAEPFVEPLGTSPFDVQLIATRLRARMPVLRLVGVAADYASVSSLQDYPAPCAYVVLGRDRGQPNQPGNAMPGQVAPVGQMMTDTFGVILVVRNYREQRGEQVTDDLRAIVGGSRGALLGFVPDVPGGRACQLLGGNLEDYDASTALWIDAYQTQHFTQSESVP